MVKLNASLVAKRATKIAKTNQKKVLKLADELKKYKHDVIQLVKHKKISKHLKDDPVFAEYYQRVLEDKSFSGTSYEATAIALYSTIIHKVFGIDPFKESKGAHAVILILFDLAISLITTSINYAIPENAVTELAKQTVAMVYNYILTLAVIYFKLYEPYGQFLMFLITGMIAGALIILLSVSKMDDHTLGILASLGVGWLISLGIIQLVRKLFRSLREGSLKTVRKLLLVIMVLMHFVSDKLLEISVKLAVRTK